MSGAEKRYDLAGIGSMVVDAIHLVPRILHADEKLLLQSDADGHTVQRLVGGVALNHLGWARILGLRVAVFGKQAEDADGRFLRDGMDRLGIERRLDLSGSASSFAEVYVNPRGERAIYMARGATGELTAAEVEERHRPVIEQAHWVSSEVSQVPLCVVRRVLELARDSGARTVLDIDVPLRDAVPALGSEEDLNALLGLADVIKSSESALAGLVTARDPEAIVAELAQRSGARIIALTQGSEGTVVYANEKAVRVPVPAARVVDTTGAGDAFLGGLVAGLHADLDMVSAAQLGNAAGACCCEQLGGFPEASEACSERVLELYRSLGGAPFQPAPIVRTPSSDAGEALARFFQVAAREVQGVCSRADRDAIAAASRLIREAEEHGGRVHVTGVGKPEHLARYAAALLASTGTAATFLHATECTHGSVGQLRPGDVLIAISNSGETLELLACVDAVRSFDARVIAVTAWPDSLLARAADLVLEARVAEEGGPLGLAPRASTLAQLVVLAALSVELQASKRFRRQDYQRRHPAGALGRRSARDS